MRKRHIARYTGVALSQSRCLHSLVSLLTGSEDVDGKLDLQTQMANTRSDIQSVLVDLTR